MRGLLGILTWVAVAAGRRVVIDNTAPKLDVDGRVVNAHDGTYTQVAGTWYYHAAQYGECLEPAGVGCGDRRANDCGFRGNHNVSIYKSPDLSSGSWVYVGAAVRCEELDVCGVLYRPHLVFNARTGKYVLFVNFEASAAARPAQHGTAVYSADGPEGPFALETRMMKLSRACPSAHRPGPCGAAQGGAGDFEVFTNPEDGSGYIAYSAGHYMSIERLTDDYFDAAADGAGNATVAGGAFRGSIFPEYFVEAPAAFRRGGTYYLLFGYCCCFCMQGSGILVYTAPHPMGPWRAQPGGDVACVTPSDPRARGNDTAPFLPGSAVPADLHVRGAATPGQGCGHAAPAGTLVSVTNAQQNVVVEVPGAAGVTYVWTGDLWQQAPDGVKGHEGQYWFPMAFDDAGRVLPARHVDTFELDV